MNPSLSLHTTRKGKDMELLGIQEDNRGQRRISRRAFLGMGGMSAAMVMVGVVAPPASAQSSILPYGSCNNLLVLVDKDHRLSSGYAPPDLAYLSSYGVPTIGSSKLLRQGAAYNLSWMWAAARRDGVYLWVSSAYRSYYEQAGLYDYWTSVYGPGAGGVSAPPGASQHQLGTAVDFTNAYAGYGLNYSFGYSYAYDWLLQNARYYGFVLSYPPGLRYYTGYWWEPWHWRYVGPDNAQNIVASGLALQGYLDRYGVLPYC